MLNDLPGRETVLFQRRSRCRTQSRSRPGFLSHFYFWCSMASQLAITMHCVPAIADRQYPEANRYVDLSIEGRATRDQIRVLTDLLSLLDSRPVFITFEFGAGI